MNKSYLSSIVRLNLNISWLKYSTSFSTFSLIIDVSYQSVRLLLRLMLALL